MDSEITVIGAKPKPVLDLDHQLYQKMDHEDERELLLRILRHEDALERLLAIGDIWTILRDHYNNEILDGYATHARDTWLDAIQAALEEHHYVLEHGVEVKGAVAPMVVTQFPFVVTREADSGREAALYCFWEIDELVGWMIEQGLAGESLRAPDSVASA